MKRRSFLKVSGAVSTASVYTAGCNESSEQPPDSPAAVNALTTLAGLSLAELREQYRSDLYDQFLPFVENYVVDREHGGFMCGVDRKGARVSDGKSTWNQGRGIWTFSYLYNNIDQDRKWLDIASRAVDFILGTRPKGDTFWHTRLTREGNPVGNPDRVVYSDIFVAFGLQEYSASGGSEYWDIAKDIMMRCVDIYDNSQGYNYLKPTETSPGVDRPRIFSHWFQIGRLAMEMLNKRDDTDVQAVSDRCVDAIMNSHYNPDFRLMTEYINHDFSHIDSDYGQAVTNHAQEVLWLVMQEAVRRGDRQLYDRAAGLFKRHVKVLWDDVYGGLFTLRHCDENRWNTSKPLWLQVEVPIGTMYMIERTGDQWAIEWFNRSYTYIRDKFYLQKHG
ncbi:AGE family epimerase/isomerase, partial [Candidatus Latescibacterota bacterium]